MSNGNLPGSREGLTGSVKARGLGIVNGTGFVRAHGAEIVNGAGEPFLLRGVGLGSWLLPEGYMWRMPAAADRPRRIEALVTDLVGPEDAARFWETYWDRFVTESDIERIAAEGFNSVRVPMNTRYLTGADDSEVIIESRIARIDRLIEWCRTWKLYVILDLHGAPGGQTGTNIDDSPADQPDLFRDPKNEDRTVAIWRSLAQRYRDEWTVAGYDLLNEPLPEWFSQYNDRVMPLYRRIIRAIREVDARHMIILEGVHWATDWSIFTEIPDDNVMLQFHKYWNNPDRESLAPYLAARERLNVPIFMGEGGENNTDWYAGAFRLFEDLNISWNFWTWKKIDTTNSPASIRRPEGWDLLASHAEGRVRLGADRAHGILREFLTNVRLSRCDYRTDVVRSLFRRVPVRIPAIFYSYQESGRGFGPAPFSDGSAQSVGFRVGDGTSIGFVDPEADGDRQPNFAHNGGEPWADGDWMYLQLDQGAWAAYDLVIPPGPPKRCRIMVRALVCDSADPGSTDAINGRPRPVLGGSSPAREPSPARHTTPALTLCVDSPPQEIPVALDGADTAYRDYWTEIDAEEGPRRIAIRSENSRVRLQFLHVTIADPGGVRLRGSPVTVSDSVFWC